MTAQIHSPSVTLTQYAAWLPADMDTPISLFRALCRDAHGILLESAEVDGRWGRYSILACDFRLIARCRAGVLALDIPDERLAPLASLEGTDFPDGLRSVMRGIELRAPDGFDLPPLTRALYGYFGYGMAGLFTPRLAACLPPARAR